MSHQNQEADEIDNTRCDDPNCESCNQNNNGNNGNNGNDDNGNEMNECGTNGEEIYASKVVASSIMAEKTQSGKSNIHESLIYRNQEANQNFMRRPKYLRGKILTNSVEMGNRNISLNSGKSVSLDSLKYSCGTQAPEGIVMVSRSLDSDNAKESLMLAHSHPRIKTNNGSSQILHKMYIIQVPKENSNEPSTGNPTIHTFNWNKNEFPSNGCGKELTISTGDSVFFTSNDQNGYCYIIHQINSSDQNWNIGEKLAEPNTSSEKFNATIKYQSSGTYYLIDPNFPDTMRLIINVNGNNPSTLFSRYEELQKHHHLVTSKSLNTFSMHYHGQTPQIFLNSSENYETHFLILAQVLMGSSNLSVDKLQKYDYTIVY